MRIGINGFGRIGRQALRALLERHPETDIVGINELAELETLAHLLRYDSNYGRFPGDVSVDGATLVVDDQRIPITSQREWDSLPWGDLRADLVIEATGVGTARDRAALHLNAGANRVLITAPGKEADLTMVMGVNHDRFDPSLHRVVSNASCTTNGLAPPLDTIRRAFGVRKGLMSTVHAYTSSQVLVDGPAGDLREARSAAMSIIPTSTGAAKAIGLVIPELAGRMHGAAYRVPVPTVSIVEFIVHLESSATAEEINDALREAANGRLRGIMTVNDEPLVSVDLRGDSHSSIVESESTMVIGDDLAKVAAWYDNEWGYACRVADAAAHVGTSVPTAAAV
jgi:glyceraldehyde 3-phosphate dehydrogenase